MVDRKRDGEHKQICAHLPIALVRRFKTLSVSRDLKQGEAVNQAIEMWVQYLEEQDNTPKAKAQDTSKEELINFLRSLSSGDKPSDTECGIVAQEVGMQTEDIIRIRDKL